jgi:hypothetical protein
MNYYLKNWYKISVLIAGLIFVIALIAPLDFRAKMVLGAMAMIHLHFYEEMGYTGGFPFMGEYLELHITNTDPKSWDLNLATTAWGNEYFAVAVYLLALLLPQYRWLTLAVMLFAFLEFAMHTFFFPIKMKFWYNPGLLTAFFGLTPISICYFIGNHQYYFNWVDYVLAIVWIVFNYWMAFKSPIYKKLGQLKQYSFGQDSVQQSLKWLKNVYKE